MHQAEAPRCAIDDSGMIIYANEAFYQLGDLSPQGAHHAIDIFNFSEDSISETNDFEHLPSGEHNVHIKGNPIITEFYFDRLTTSDGRSYVIASATDTLESPQQQDEDLDTLMARIQNSTARLGVSETEEKSAPEQKQQTSVNSQPAERDVQAFLNMTSEIMLVLDEQGDIISANNAFSEQLKYDIDTVSFLDLFEDEDKHYVRTSMQSLVYESEYESGQVIDFEARIFTRDGTSRWVEWRQKYENGNIYTTGHDITAIKQKQNDLRRRATQLSEAEGIARMGHWRWLIGDEDITCSAEIYNIFGLDKENFTPTINGLTTYVHKRDLGRVMQVFQRAMIEEKSYDMEFRIDRPDGEARFIMCEGRCEKNDEGEVIALYGIMQDMTERMLYEQELRRAKDASEQAYDAKSRFLANMSHELRTPLNAIIGFSEMIEGELLGPIFNEKYTEYATSIKDSGIHLLDLISDILDMSKIEAGKHTLDLEDIKVSDVIKRASQMVQGRAQEKHIELKTPEPESTDFEITADRRAVTQVILNLLSNAIKFTTAHGAIEVTCEKGENNITLQIRDTGIGIPPNKLAAVMRPFEQASSQYTRDHEGTGLGLSITKELVELHGGTMSIDSTVDIGTVVSVRLPYIARTKSDD